MVLTRPDHPAFTVVVGSDDSDGLRTRELALQWHAEGLLQGFAWVTPADVHEEPYGPPVVMATIAGRSDQIELMTYLGMRPRLLVRVVLLHLLTHEHSDPRRLVGACDEIAGLVQRAMPRKLMSTDTDPAAQLLRVNLMVPESDLLPQGRELILPAWEVNAIVSPEDRPDVDRMSVFVRRSVNLHGHALAAAAAAGGLWAGAEVGAFDSHESDSTTGGGEIVVIRCQARMVVGDDRSAELSAHVIDNLQRSELGAASWLRWGVPAQNPSAVVRNSVEKLFTHPEWAPRAVEPRPLEKAQLSLGTVLRSWALFQLAMPLAVLHFLFGIGRSLVERSVTAATVGREAGEQGRVRPLSPEQVQEVARFRLRALADELRPQRLDDEAASWGQTTPGAWRELRELAIGLVDGSRLPDRFVRASRGGIIEVVPPATIVEPPVTLRRPQHLLPAEQQQPQPALTAEGATEQRPGSEQLPGAEESVDSETADDTVTAEQPTADQPTPAPPADESPADESPADESPADEPADEDLLDGHDEDDEDEPVEESPPLLAQLALRVKETARRERGSARHAEEQLSSTTAPSTDRLVARQQLLTGAWGLTLLAAVLLTVWVVGEAMTDDVPLLSRVPDVDWSDVAVVVPLVIGALLTVGTLYFQALRAYEWEVTKRLHTVREASDEYVAARHQERRWKIMQAGVRDWTTVFRELLHRPWEDPTEHDETPRHYEGLPAAAAVAVPAEAHHGPDPRLVARAIEHVCQKGWLAEEFQRVVAASPGNDPDAQPHAGDLPADLDLGLRPTGPRRELAEVARLAATKVAATEHLVQKVSELLRNGDVRMPPQTVIRVGPYSSGDPLLDRTFFSMDTDDVLPFVQELFHPHALLERHNVPERSVFCLPSGAPRPTSARAETHPCAHALAMRVDVSPLLSIDNISLFTRIQRQHRQSSADVTEYN